jgi:1-acyl-sn-glycerol-3-phosphate acyltransferase
MLSDGAPPAAGRDPQRRVAPTPAAERSEVGWAARAARLVASLVATTTGNLFLVFGTIFLAAGAVATGWIPLPRGGRVFFFWARLWSRLLLLCSGVWVTKEQLSPLSRDQVYVFVSNHQSLFDIPVLLATLPVPARFLAKRELFAIPVFGWSLRIGGFIPVERGGRSAGDSFRAATERLRHGGSVLLFPEETRSPDGRLLPFKRGGFLLAQKAALPMVPVGISGTLAVRPRSSYRIHPGRVRVRYGEPLPPVGAGRGEQTQSLALARRRIAELAGVEVPTPGPEGDA